MKMEIFKTADIPQEEEPAKAEKQVKGNEPVKEDENHLYIRSVPLDKTKETKFERREGTKTPKYIMDKAMYNLDQSVTNEADIAKLRQALKSRPCKLFSGTLDVSPELTGFLDNYRIKIESALGQMRDARLNENINSLDDLADYAINNPSIVRECPRLLGGLAEEKKEEERISREEKEKRRAHLRLVEPK